MAIGQRDAQRRRYHGDLSRPEHHGRVLGYRGQQIEAGGMRGLVGRQRQAVAMGKLPDFDANGFGGSAHHMTSFAMASAMRATRVAATCSLPIVGHESTAM